MLLPPLPDEAPPVEREVPLREVFALDEMLLLVLLLDSTVELAPAVEEGDSAEEELTLDRGDKVLMLAVASAEVDDAGDEMLLAEEGVNSEFPEEADAPAPAADDEPPLFDVAVEAELPVNEDWM